MGLIWGEGKVGIDQDGGILKNFCYQEYEVILKYRKGYFYINVINKKFYLSFMKWVYKMIIFLQ